MSFYVIFDDGIGVEWVRVFKLPQTLHAKFPTCPHFNPSFTAKMNFEAFCPEI